MKWQETLYGGGTDARLATGLAMHCAYSVVKGEGYVGYVFGEPVRGNFPSMKEAQKECESVAIRRLRIALRKLEEK